MIRLARAQGLPCDDCAVDWLEGLGHQALAILRLGEGRDELRCDLRDDGIAVTPQSSQAGGYPMIQRECAGLNWPPLFISAEGPIAIAPFDRIRMGPTI